MKTTYATLVKATTSRDIDNLPEDWTVVTTVAKPASHKWDEQKNINLDAMEFEKQILAPLSEYLARRGIEVDFDDIVLTDLVTRRHIYKRLPHFFENSGDKEYIFSSDDENETKVQYRVRRDKKMNVRGTTPVATLDPMDDTVWALDASGNLARNTHTFLDFFAMARENVEHDINLSIARRYGGHVRIKLVKIGSVAVNGTA